jgi:hypothetical protein
VVGVAASALGSSGGGSNAAATATHP